MTEKSNKIFGKICSICLVICMLISVCTSCGSSQHVAAESEVTELEPTAAPTESVQDEMSVTDLMKAVTSVKANLKDALSSIGDGDLEKAEATLETISQNTHTVRLSINATIKNLGDSAVSIQNKLKSILEILDFVDIVSQKLLVPTVMQLKAYPATQLRTDTGISTQWLIQYLDYAESLMPDVEATLEFAKTVDLSIVDDDGEIRDYLKSADELMEIYREDSMLFSRAKSVLGADGDRLYLIAVQNSAEIRASGGFPGSMGTIRIKDGILTLEKFKSVYSVLSFGTPENVRLTSEELRLFNYLSGMQAPRDADLCPDFERVAYIWASGYETLNKESVDGIITMTPHIVQRILAAIDEEVVLFDGMKLNGENATTVLQHDIYFKYYSKNSAEDDVNVDRLFADAAQKTMTVLMENLSVSQLFEYMSIAEESIADRTLMLWMNDEDAQSFVRKMGWHGGLNNDPTNPEAGVYFNCVVPSKMGWFLLMDTEIGERTANSDGSYSYPVTVTFSNNITEEENKAADYYITAGYGGSIHGAAYFFAPAGGTVSNFVTGTGLSVRLETYHDLKLGFMSYLSIRPGKSISVSYTVTTAPGVETPLVFSKTPTAQANP